MIITGNNAEKLKQFVTKLHQMFSLKDLGPLHYFLGVEVHRDETGMFLSQPKYVEELLRRASTLR